MKRLLIILLLPAQLLFGQTNTLTLDDCYRLARENYPKLTDIEKQQQISALRISNIGSAWNPQLNLNAQATYQSDVTRIALPMPGIEIPALPKDQYKAYLDVRQNIYDGGISRSSRELEKASLEADIQNIEVEINVLNDRINQLFFGTLSLDESKKILALKEQTLGERLKVLESGYRNGMVTLRDVELIRAEILLTRQQLAEVEAEKISAAGSLRILTGAKIGPETILAEPIAAVTTRSVNRPELKLFDLLGNKIETNSSLLQTMRNPKLFAFGQAGYGRPGLNMLATEFDSYYLVGVGLSWNIFDWNQTSRNRQMLNLQKEMVTSSRNLFNQNLEISLFRAHESIKKAENLLQSDKQLLAMRGKIAQQSASQLENGTITSADYIVDLNAETQAKINQQSHKIALLQAIANYNTLTGNQILP